MRIALDEEGLAAKQQCSIPVLFHGQVVGDFVADFMIEDRLIVELKSVQSLSKEHEVQLVNYSTATGIDDGLLINFGTSVEVRRKYRLYRNCHDKQDCSQMD